MSRERERLDEIGKKIKRDINQQLVGDDHQSSSPISSHQNMGRRHLLGPPGTLNTVTPCAACKLLRRRCAEECPFSPYFSPHEPHKFAAVHKVFGASNVSKLLLEVPESQRGDAANSLVYEANVRIRDPVYGCMGAIAALQQQIQALQAEVNAVRNEILKYKFREVAATTANPCNNTNIITSSNLHHQQHQHQHQHQQQVVEHHEHLIVSSSGTVSVALLPSDHHQQQHQHQQQHHQHQHQHQLAPLPSPSLPPPPPPPQSNIPLPSVVVVASALSSSSSPSSSSTSLYMAPSSTTGYSSISCDSSVPYFD